MWTSRSEQTAGGRGIKVIPELNSRGVAYAEVVRRWQGDPVWRTFFISLLADAPFAAFRWETPPITAATATRPFEFVLLESPELLVPPDAAAFAQHFKAAPKLGAVEFANLGRDAVLIAPCPGGPHLAYAHLAAFARQAPEAQRHALWQLVGAASQRRLSAKPVWLSTAGAGVAWLHVRLDDRPKYYDHAPYRQVSSESKA